MNTTTLVVAGLVAAFALAGPASATATVQVSPEPSDGQLICPPFPFPLNVVCDTVSGICDETRLCE